MKRKLVLIMAENNNQKIANILLTLSEKYRAVGGKQLSFKAAALKSAANKILACPVIITSEQIAIQEAGVSTRIGKKVDEILSTGRLSELDELEGSGGSGGGGGSSGDGGGGGSKITAIQELTQITGLGPKRARTLIDEGITSIGQLKKAVQEGQVKLTHHILEGLKWHQDIQVRIPASEVAKIEKILQKELKKISGHLVLTICGSYRRGRTDCGDIDVLMTDPSKPEESLAPYGYLKKFVSRLRNTGFIVGDLTSMGDKKYMGICRLPGNGNGEGHLGRRIDIRCVDYISYFAALIYFTGSKNFNIDIRRKALDRGYSLNEYFFTKKDTGEKLVVHSEKEVFDILGMDFVPPTARDI